MYMAALMTLQLQIEQHLVWVFIFMIDPLDKPKSRFVLVLTEIEHNGVFFDEEEEAHKHPGAHYYRKRVYKPPKVVVHICFQSEIVSFVSDDLWVVVILW
jgi:hypothetical protein